MALFGDVGKFLGLGTAKQTLSSAAQGALRGAIVGQPFMGATAGALTAGTQQGQATAVSVPQTPPAETQFSGEVPSVPSPAARAQPISYSPGIQPAIMRTPIVPQKQQITPAALPAIIGGGVGAARGLGMMLGLGAAAATVAPIIIDPLTGEEKKLRVTRRLKSQVKKAVEFFGVEATAEAMGTDIEVVFYILTKLMRNDGPYVTKAAVRKTRQTVRKMKNLCDMYDDLRPAAKRRAPSRAASRTRVVNVK